MYGVIVRSSLIHLKLGHTIGVLGHSIKQVIKVIIP